MHIALLRQRLSGGGAETTLGYLVWGLAAAGHQVTVLGTEPPAAARQALGTAAAYVPVPVWGGRSGRLLSFAVNSRRRLQQLRPQVVFSLERTLHQHVYRAGDGCHRAWLARRQAALPRWAGLGQRLSPFHRLMLWLEGRLFASPELRQVIANSRLVRQEVMHHYGMLPEKIRVIHNGVDHQRFFPLPQAERLSGRRRLGLGAKDRVVLFVGSGFARKGLACLVAALGRLKEKGVRLWVAGKGAPGPYLALADRWGLRRDVLFLGAVAEVAPLYQVAEAVALPTLYDPCSNVVLEALACGCPVVTTAANGAAEFVVPGENGEVLADPLDPDGLAQALGRVLSRGRDRRVEEAAVAAVAGLSWEETVAQTLKVLETARGL